MTFAASILFVSAYLYCSLLLYYRYHWLQLKKPGKAASTILPSITVVIPARNEAENIGSCLQSVLANNYKGKVEIVVVDDHSEDETAAIVSSFEKVKLLRLKDYASGSINSYKKKAIEIAIANSSGEIIVCTDADCLVPGQWLNRIADCFSKTGFQFLAMPVKIDREGKPGFLPVFQSLDLLTYQGLTGAAIHANNPMLCNGANLAYTRTAFKAVDGFAGIEQRASGDDVLLMHKIDRAFPRSVFFLKDESVIVKTTPMATVSAFLNQRIRWASKTTQYKEFRVTLVAAIVWLFNLSLLIFPFFFLFGDKEIAFSGFSTGAGILWLACIITKVMVEIFYLQPVAQFFNEKNWLTWFLVSQPIHIFYSVFAGFLGLVGNYQWKGRQVK